MIWSGLWTTALPAYGEIHTSPISNICVFKVQSVIMISVLFIPSPLVDNIWAIVRWPCCQNDTVFVQIVQTMRFRVQTSNLRARVWNSGRSVCMAFVLVNVLQSIMNVVLTIDVWTTIPLSAAVRFCHAPRKKTSWLVCVKLSFYRVTHMRYMLWPSL